MDLTQITTPFGLLDAETREALEAHSGPIECYTLNGRWQELTWDFDWIDQHVYRVKPEPAKPREWWIVPRSDGMAWHYDSRGAALSQWPEDQAILVREVL
jgi:hypothetical protein